MITKSPNTKLLISQELLNIIICFNVHHEALFNALLSAIDRSHGDTRSSMFAYNTDLLPIDYHLSLNRTKDCPKIVRLSLFQNNSTPICRTIGSDHVVVCLGVQTTTIMYLRTICLRINLRLNNIFCYCLNFAFLILLNIKFLNHKSVSSHL